MHNSIVILSSEKIVSYEVIISLGKLCTGAEKFLREIMQLPTRNSEEPYFISGVSYFFADYILFGTWSVLLVSLTQSFIQSAGSAIFFGIIGCALDKVHVKNRFF